MNILYLHGLESKLSPEKATVLEKYGNVFAPDLAYYANPKIFLELYETYQHKAIDCIIGSSMGGFMGYYLAMALNCKSLLFNPALASRTITQELPDKLYPKENTSYNIVLGWEDTVVPAKKTLEFLKENAFQSVAYHVNCVPNLAHQIPVPIFENQIQSFFNTL